jgi:Tfp pilus assembly protein PilN
MSQVNLLPPELLERQARLRRTRLVVVAGSAVLVLIALFYVLQIFRLSSAKSALDAQEAQNAKLTGQISALSKFSDLQHELKDKQHLVDTVLANQYSWSSALLDVSHAIPDNAALSGFSGQITVQTGTPAGAVTAVVGGTTDVVGTIAFQGSALDIRTVATWLVQLEQVKGWAQARVNSVTEQAASSNIYQFDTTVQITKDALKPPEATP